jgi:hypothetical protein
MMDSLFEGITNYDNRLMSLGDDWKGFALSFYLYPTTTALLL